MIIPSRPWKQLSLNLYPNDLMPDSNRHLQEDLLDTPLPEGWRLRETEDGEFYAEHEHIGRTGAWAEPDPVSVQAHKLHQKYINEMERPHPDFEPDSTDPESDDNETALQATDQKPQMPDRTVEVFDAETGDLVERTPQQQRMAMQLLRAIQMSTMVQAVAIARLESGKHYLDLGHSSFKEFAQADLPYAYSTAKVYLRIGRRFQDLLPALDASEEATIQALQEQVEDSDEVEPFAAMGTRKLRAITKLDDDDFEQLSSEKRLVDPESGEEWTLDEIKEMTARDMTSLVEEHQREKRAYMSRISQLEEENKRLESEREQDEEKVERAEEKMDDALALEREYGPASQRYKDQQSGLEEMRGHLQALRRAAATFETDADTDQGIKNAIVEVLREMSAVRSDIHARHADAIRTAEDTIEMEMWEPPQDIMDEIAQFNEGDGFDDDLADL